MLAIRRPSYGGKKNPNAAALCDKTISAKEEKMEKEQTNRNMDGIVEKKVLAEICFEEELAPTCKT